MLVTLVACDQPPLKEIDAAQAALGRAEQAGAPTYAAERYGAARRTLELARQRLAQKDYRGALSAANEAGDKARAAEQSARSSKRLAASAAELSQAEVEAALEDVQSIRQEAEKARVPDEAFGAIDSEVEQLHQGLKNLAAALAGEDYQAAQQRGEQLKAASRGLAERCRQAESDWEAAHPRRGKGRTARRR